jgi:hypothetical protein
MMFIIIGWYVPVLVLAARDPLVRDLAWSAGKTGAIAVVRVLTHSAHQTVVRFIACARTLRQPPSDDEWIVIKSDL